MDAQSGDDDRRVGQGRERKEDRQRKLAGSSQVQWRDVRTATHNGVRPFLSRPLLPGYFLHV